MDNIEKAGLHLLKELISLILFIAMFAPEASEEVCGFPLNVPPEHTESSSFTNRFGKFSIHLAARTVTTGVYGYPSTEVTYSVLHDWDVLYPTSLEGGCVIGGDMISPDEVILVPLGEEGKQVGWIISVDGISGNTFSYKIHLVIPSYNSLEWKYHCVTFLAKDGVIVVPEENGMQVWSQYQEWGGNGTAVSFFVPQLRRVHVTDEGRAHVGLDRLPPDYKKWPPFKYISFFGLYLAGAENLNPELMEASLELFEPDDAPVCKIHGLPEDEEGLRRLIEEVRSTRMLLASFRHFDLDWEGNFRGETVLHGLEDLYEETR